MLLSFPQKVHGRLLACVLAFAATGSAQNADGNQPFRMSENHRYLTSRDNSPFLLQGDAAWSIIANLTKEEAAQYLENRHAKEFNAVLVNLIEHKFAKNAPKNVYGEAPFPKMSDWSVQNEKYFEHADWVIRKAAQKGMVVLLAPVYLGYPGTDEGFIEEVMANGPEKLLQYGQFLGQRYKDFDNIIWVMGGDRDPGPTREDVDMVALASGNTTNVTFFPRIVTRTPRLRSNIPGHGSRSTPAMPIRSCISVLSRPTIASR